MYVYINIDISDILFPIWEYPHTGFSLPFIPPHPHPALTAAAAACGGVGWEESFMGIFPYWIYDVGLLFICTYLSNN